MLAKHPKHSDAETSIVSRAAWLHYAGGLTQTEVARRLGLSTVKAHRLISRANERGMIKFFIDGEITECIALEDTLRKAFGLETCEVVPEVDTDELPLRALGIAGAQYFKRIIDRGEHRLVGVGHGRTLAASVERLPSSNACETDFVSLIGGFSRKFSANPHDVIHRLAERTGATGYVVPVPFFANNGVDRTLLLEQPGVGEVFELAGQSTLKIVGIGATNPSSTLVTAGMIARADIDAVQRAGGAGELLGHFFNADGDVVETPLSERTMTLAPSKLVGGGIVAIAGGSQKIEAIQSVLRSGYLHGLITDERSARALIR